jgi:hypothetical protein
MHCRCDYCGTVERNDTTSSYPVGWLTRFIYKPDGTNRVLHFCSTRCAFLEQERALYIAPKEQPCPRP